MKRTNKRYIAVAGSRGWGKCHPEDIESVYEALAPYVGEPVIVLHGGQPGLDAVVERAAKRLGLETHVEKLKRSKKGPKEEERLRNKWMLAKGPEAVFVFHRKLYKSSNSVDMLGQALKAGCKVVNYRGSHGEVELTDLSFDEAFDKHSERKLAVAA